MWPKIRKDNIIYFFKNTIKKLTIFFCYYRERTTVMSILNGLGIAVFPIAEFASGQLYNVSIFLLYFKID